MSIVPLPFFFSDFACFIEFFAYLFSRYMQGELYKVVLEYFKTERRDGRATVNSNKELIFPDYADGRKVVLIKG